MKLKGISKNLNGFLEMQQIYYAVEKFLNKNKENLKKINMFD